LVSYFFINIILNKYLLNLLLLGIDGWTNPNGSSIWNYVITTSNHYEYLYKLDDLSSNSHTRLYLASKIKEIMEKIGPHRITAIVSDSGANINNARSLIKAEYKHIINLRCISYCLNLISKDIIKHQFADRLIRRANIVITFFKRSHLAHHRLLQLIEEKKIKGGGLKSYVPTRWITCHEATDSIVRLSDVLREVCIKIYIIFI